MKKVILGVLIFISAMACSDVNINEENLIKENGSIEKLTKDKNFIIINEEMKSFSIYIEAVIKNQELTSSELISKINDIVNSQFSEQEQLLHLNKLFKTDITNRVINNGQIISLNLAVLNSKYENIDEKLLTDVFNSNLINDKKKSEFSHREEECGWRYSLCLGAAFTGAVLCHAGCDTTALSTTAGLGIPACVALCGTLQVFASVQCYDSYCADSE